ncbi:MAG: NADPH-dependent oxidoreductase [Bacteroides sp.]|nr:NADPH-dependent oxidoreductase [Bacteroides sp.]
MTINPFFAERRTVRNYDPERKLSLEEITAMLEAASQAPNTGNMQIYSVVVTRDEATRRALSPAHFGQSSVMSAQAVLTFCVDFNRFEKWCRQRNAEPGYDNFQAFMWGVIDATIFAQQFVTIAEMNGLGTCYLGTVTYNAPQIAEVLDLPARVVPVATVTVGYPAADAPKSDRLPIKGIVHDEKYHDYSPADIDEIYAEKEALPDSAKFIAENGKETLAQVFTDVRYKREDNEYFSKVFSDFIKKQGF